MQAMGLSYVENLHSVPQIPHKLYVHLYMYMEQGKNKFRSNAERF